MVGAMSCFSCLVSYLRKWALLNQRKKTCLIVILCVYALSFFRATPSSGAEKPIIAVLLSSSAGPYHEALQGFFAELKRRRLDYDVVQFTDKDLEGDDALSLVKRVNPALIHTVGTKTTALARTEFNNIPIVFSMVLNPVASGVVKDMSSTGENITGASMDIPLNIQFSHLKNILPGIKRVGVIYNEDETGVIVRDAEAAANSLGLELVKVAVMSPGGVPGALNRLKAEKIDCLWSVADSNVFTRETARELLMVTLKEKIPFIGLSNSFVKAGALAAFHMDAADIGRQAASMAYNILKGGDPSVVPVSVPEKIKILLNSNTIDVIGITVPGSIYDSAEIFTP